VQRRLRLRVKRLTSDLSTKASKLFFGQNAVAVISQTENGLFATDPQDMGVGKVLRKTGAYGQDELARVLAHIGTDESALVVGAHIGSLVVPIAKNCKQVVAIEANPDNFRLLKINLFLNAAANVRAENIAASDKTEMIEFVASRANSGGSKRMPQVRAFEYFYDSPNTVSIRAHALDQFLERQSFSLVFMDIEGSEYFALTGMQKILSVARALFVEFIPHHLRNVSGVTPAEFVALIAPHFANLEIPSKTLHVKNSEFLPLLQGMFDRDEEDEGLIFTK